MNRRAQAEMIEWLPRLILLLVALIIIVVIVAYYANREVDSASTERVARLYRLYYDGNIITYSDPTTKRVYPGVVDLSKFKSESLVAVFTGKSGLLNMGYTASCLTLSFDTGPYAQRTICDDKKLYDDFIAQAQIGLAGPQGASMENVTFPVAIRDGAALTSGKLNIVVVRRSS
jgi:hypothetical protein